LTIDLLATCWRRKIFMIVFTACFFLITLIALLCVKLTYESTTVIRLMRLTDPASGMTQESSLYDKLSFIETHKNMIKSRTVLARLIDALPFLQGWGDPKPGQNPEIAKERLLARLQKSIILRHIKFTDIMDVAVRGPDKREVAIVANTLIRIYHDWLEEENARTYETTVQFLGKRVTLARNKLQEVEENLREYGEAQDVISIDEEIKDKLKAANDLAIAIADINAKIEYYTEVLEKVRASKESISTMVALADNDVITDLAKSYDALELRVRLSRKYLQPDHPKYIELIDRRTNLVDELHKRLMEVFQTKIMELRVLKSKKTDEMNNYKKELYGLKKKYQSIERLRREFKTNEEAYLRLLKNYEASEVLEARKSLVEVVTISPAAEPLKHILPKRTRTMILGMIFGFFMSLCIVLLQERFKKIY